MPEQRNLEDRDMALGAAVASSMARQDRRDQEHIRATKLSTSSTVASIAFVAGTSIGMLILMLIFGN